MIIFSEFEKYAPDIKNISTVQYHKDLRHENYWRNWSPPMRRNGALVLARGVDRHFFAVHFFPVERSLIPKNPPIWNLSSRMSSAPRVFKLF